MSVDPRQVPPALTVAVPAELVDAIAAALEPVLEARLRDRLELERGPEPWIGVDDAARHLGYDEDRLDRGRKRIYDLVGQRRVRVFRDGRRLLFRRSWLDEALEEGPPA